MASKKASKKASALISNVKAAFATPKSKLWTRTNPEAGADTIRPPQKAAGASKQASRDTFRSGRPALVVHADAGITIEQYPDFAETVQAVISAEDSDPTPVFPPPTTTKTITNDTNKTNNIITNTTATTITSRPTSARPCDIISRHASLLSTPSPQPTLIDLPAELSKNGKFKSPLPVNPAAAPLSRAHFRCPAKHAGLGESSNLHAPTLCTTCHGSGDAVLACCRFCYLRMCKRCAGLLGGMCGNDLERLLAELVRLGVWRGLHGQG